jgi:hypothetical protein
MRLKDYRMVRGSTTRKILLKRKTLDEVGKDPPYSFITYTFSYDDFELSFLVWLRVSVAKVFLC